MVLFLATLFGTSLVIASACVFNNYIDRGLDVHMARTKRRALVTGTISGRQALIFATCLGLLGISLLAAFTNWLVVLIGLIAFVDYVVLYGWSKRRSVHGTIVGSISGAAPITAGYTAVTNHVGLGAALLFLVLVIWQMPHFYAIAMYRYSDYKKAKLPVLPVVKGMAHTKIQIIIYVCAFVLATLQLTVFKYTGYTFAAVMLIVGTGWIWLALKGFNDVDDGKWARQMFRYSLIVILIFSVILSVGSLLP